MRPILKSGSLFVLLVVLGSGILFSQINNLPTKKELSSIKADIYETSIRAMSSSSNFAGKDGDTYRAYSDVAEIGAAANRTLTFFATLMEIEGRMQAQEDRQTVKEVMAKRIPDLRGDLKHGLDRLNLVIETAIRPGVATVANEMRANISGALRMLEAIRF